MAPKYEFKYFVLHGLGCMDRIIMEDQGIEYTFTGVDFAAWPSVKPTTPFGQLPVLVIDGKTQISQSHAIFRYIARECNLMGSNNVEAAQIDMFIDQVNDVRKKFLSMCYDKDYESKRQPFLDSVAEYLAPFEKVLESNSNKDFILFGKLTAADYMLFDLLFALNSFSSQCLAKSPNVRAFFESFGSRPKLRAYLDRPEIKSYKFTGSGNF